PSFVLLLLVCASFMSPLLCFIEPFGGVSVFAALQQSGNEHIDHNPEVTAISLSFIYSIVGVIAVCRRRTTNTLLLWIVGRNGVFDAVLEIFNIVLYLCDEIGK